MVVGGGVGGEELAVCRHHSLSRDSELMQQFEVHVTNKGKQRNRKRRLLALRSKQPNVSEGDGRQRKPGSAETERKLHPLMCFLFCGKYEKLFSFVLRCVMFQRQRGVCGRPHNWCRSSNVEISRPLFNVSLRPTKILFEFEFILNQIFAIKQQQQKNNNPKKLNICYKLASASLDVSGNEASETFISSCCLRRCSLQHCLQRFPRPAYQMLRATQLPSKALA